MTGEQFRDLPKSVQDLAIMVADAYDACKQESMCCPWCSGRVGWSLEYHDEFCTWPRFFSEYIKGPREAKT